MPDGQAMVDSWWPEELEALRPPEGLDVAQWAERYRELDPYFSREPGPWNNDRIPMLRGIMEALSLRTTRTCAIVKPRQVGGSEVLLNLLAWIVDEHPSPTQLTIDKKENLDWFQERIEKMLDASERLDGHRSGFAADEKGRRFLFDRMLLYFGSAQTKGDCIGKAVRVLLNDEVDAWPAGVGKSQEDPLALLRGMLTTFEDESLEVDVSTPTIPEGRIWQAWLASDQREFWIPCPSCGAFQTLKFPNLRLKAGHEDERDPQRIEAEDLATYFCGGCGTAIEDHDKPAALLRGSWIQAAAAGGDDQPDTVTGKELAAIAAKQTVEARIGFRFWAAYSPFKTWSSILGAWFRANQTGDPNTLRVCVNDVLADAFEEAGEELELAQLHGRVLDYDEGTVPEGAIALTAYVDVQQDYYRLVVRAWGQDLESWLVTAKRIETLDSLGRALFLTSYDGHEIALAGIDARFEPWRAFEVVQAWPDRCRYCQGDTSQTGLPFRTSVIDKHPGTGAPLKGSPRRWLLNTVLFKNQLLRLIQTPPGQAGGWWIHKDPAEAYLEELVSEKKVYRPNVRTALAGYVWLKRYRQKPNHFWDCETGALAMARLLGLDTVTSEAVAAAQAQAQEKQAATARAAQRPKKGGSWRDGYRGTRKGRRR